MLCSPTRRAMPEFRRLLFSHADIERQSLSRLLGNAVRRASEHEYTVVQPILTAGGIAYGITEYADRSLTIIRDNDYPKMSIPEHYNPMLPRGLRVALTIAERRDSILAEKFKGKCAYSQKKLTDPAHIFQGLEGYKWYSAQGQKRLISYLRDLLCI